MKKILVVLGAYNSSDGELDDIAKSRLDRCLELYSKGTPILCTGGWGSHFNTAPEAHAVYAQRYLLEKGVSEEDLEAPALSKNTVDDAVKIKEIVNKDQQPQLTIITSDYHMVRVRLIFEQILKEMKIKYESVATDMKKEEFQRLINHEREAVNAIVKNGLYF